MMNITVTIDTSDRLQRVLETIAAKLTAEPQPVHQTIINSAPVPVQPVPSITPMAQPVPQTTTVLPIQPAPLPTSAPSYTIEQIMQAAGIFAEVSQDAYNAVVGLLSKYGIDALMNLPQEQYGAFVTDLRALGAAI